MSSASKWAPLTPEPLDEEFDFLYSSDDEIVLDEPIDEQALPMDDSTIASPPLVPEVVVQPPSSLAAPPSPKQAIEERLFEKAQEESSPRSRERSGSVRASSLLTDAPVDENTDALTQEVSLSPVSLKL